METLNYMIVTILNKNMKNLIKTFKIILQTLFNHDIVIFVPDKRKIY